MLRGRKIGGNFEQTALDFIGANEGFASRIYSDGAGVPTIGYGYGLLVKDGNGTFAVRSTLAGDFSGIHSFTSAERSLLGKIAADLNAQDTAQAEADLRNRGQRLAFAISESEGVTLFSHALDQNIAAAGLSTIADSQAIAGTYELVALDDIVYQSPSYISAAFRDAITKGRRLVAWLDILTTMNGNRLGSIELRRERDADEFGLYSQGDAPSRSDGGAEAIRAVRFLNRHRESTVAYMQGHGLTTTMANAYLATAYAPARTELARVFGTVATSFSHFVVARNDRGVRLKVAFKAGSALILSGRGDDTIADDGTSGRTDVIYVRGQKATVSGGTAADRTDVLVAFGHAIGQKLRLNRLGRARDAYGRIFSYDRTGGTVTISDAGKGAVTISGFTQGDFGLTLTQPASGAAPRHSDLLAAARLFHQAIASSGGHGMAQTWERLSVPGLGAERPLALHGAERA